MAPAKSSPFNSETSQADDLPHETQNGPATPEKELSDVDGARSFRASKSKKLSSQDLVAHLRSNSASLPRFASNPLKMGLPKGKPGLDSQLDGKCRAMGAQQTIHSVLVANNGIAAVKFIRSIRSWAYKTVGSERAVAIVAMATPEDMRIDAEHVRMADQFVEVPGGSNNNNYANVPLISEIAERANVDAVWPGWGHASEKPELPTALGDLPNPVQFLGPPAGPMAALGDKIGSSILAQAAGVPTIPWSGSGLSVNYAECNGEVPADVYAAACINDAQEALASCQKIGFPVMLKASWGGGGKGIRKCLTEDEVQSAFKQVQGEVPGSPIFAMKLAATSRHLEVQLICDKYGNVCSLYSRDCSVQRRHQKIVEEGPVTKASAELLREMERCARSLAKSVQYVGAATVEYLYDLEAGKYYFLELNPRLQVEHPVTEWISQVNIPSCQLMIGMGIPLHRIPEIRRVFGQSMQGEEPIDFDNDPQVAPQGHVVAVRVTCEDADNGFKPTCGSIDELSFRTSPEVWGYFSVKSGGGIHEYSDSQFGHLFAKGESREAAIRAMVVALKEVKIRGEIRTIVDYAIEMIQSDEFVNNEINTGWLDSRIASQVKAEKPVWYVSVAAGAILRTLEVIAADQSEFVSYLEKGHLPPSNLNPTRFEEVFVLEGVKYDVSIARTAPNAFRVSLGTVSVDAVVRKLNDGGMQMQLDGQSYVVHSEQEALGTRLSIDTLTCLLEKQSDPSCLIAASPGKLMRFFVEDGDHVGRDQPYAEVEVMKMVMPLVSEESGILRHNMIEGALLTAGDVIANLELDNPEAAKQVTVFEGSFPELGPPLIYSSKVDQKFKIALASAKNVMQGYEHPVEQVVSDLLQSIEDPALALLQWEENFSVAQTRMPASLASTLQSIIRDFAEDISGSQNSEEDQSDYYAAYTPQFPSEELLDAMRSEIQKAEFIDRNALEAQLEPLIKVGELHALGRQQYARSIALDLLQEFLVVEEQFAANRGLTEQEVIESLRLAYSDNLSQVADIVLSHHGLKHKIKLALEIIQHLVLPAPEHFRPLLRRLAALGQDSNEVARQAQHLLEHSLLCELHNVVARALSGLDMFEGRQLTEADLCGSEDSQDEPKTLAQVQDQNDLVRRATMIEGLYSGLDDGPRLSSHALEAKMKLLVEAPAAVEDALASLLDHPDQAIQWRALITYINRVYHPYVVSEPEIGADDSGVWASWIHKSPLSSLDSPLSISSAAVLPSLEGLPLALRLAEERTRNTGVNDGARGTLHVILPSNGDNVFGLSDDAFQYLKTAGRLATQLMASPACKMNTTSDKGHVDSRVVVSAIIAQVLSLSSQFVNAGFQYVSVLSRHGRMLPLRVGFRRSGDELVPCPLLCAVEPSMAEMLELSKLTSYGHKVTYSPSINRQCHTYAVTEQADPRSHAVHRVFSRCLIRHLGKPALLAATYKNDAGGIAAAAMEEVEVALVTCLHELERLSFMSIEQGAMKADWAHVFLSILPHLPLANGRDETRIAMALRTACAGIMSRFGSTLRRAAVAQIEIRLRADEDSMPWRLVLSSPTGHEFGEDNVSIYRESVTGDRVYLPLQSRTEHPGLLANARILDPYKPLQVLDQRRLAARRHKTTYCYDFPSVFQTALRDIWSLRARNGEPGARPLGDLVEAEELVMPASGSFSQPAPAERVNRPAGENNVGMVAWLLTMKTPECPQGRQVVAVANDITYSSGAFGPREDAVFRAITEYALEERLPLIYLAANSGARVGLATELKRCFKVEWNDSQDPSRGFKHLYLSDEDYTHLAQNTDVTPLKATPIVNRGQKQWIVSDIIGSEDGLGVECLSGSGAIGSVYSKAYKEGLPITFVTGRSVGIGAYLARLGRRCIQRADQPIILTGYAALNKLLGREVYTSHMQLGGPKVMGVNGVSHEIVADDLEGASAILQWLSTMPPVIGSPPAPLPTSDPLDRNIGYTPMPGEKLDPRAAIKGRVGPGHAWESGLFDKDTWREANVGWARTVVTGRARLGGIAVGVIAVESATTLLNLPADPGAPDTAERVIPQAGQVWFPDSATKTAHAIEEFDREGLPLIILANWRGFSGGQRDLFEGVLQAGSLIVENLRTYRQPVTVYLPPGSELRGGAWVVIDSQINASQIEMYADPTARGGVLEPEGMVEIKFRSSDLIAAMHRLDQGIAALKASNDPNTAKAIKKREADLLPVYRQVAVAFAEMHDTPVRMVAKGVINGIIPWARARLFLTLRLKRRLAQEEILKHITTTDSSIQRSIAYTMLQQWYSSFPKGKWRPATRANSPSPHPGRPGSAQAEGFQFDSARGDAREGKGWENDKAFLAWAEGAGAVIIAKELKVLRTNAALRAVAELTSSPEGKAGLLQGLTKAIKNDAALRAQLHSVMNQQFSRTPSKVLSQDSFRRDRMSGGSSTTSSLQASEGSSRENGRVASSYRRLES